MGYRIDYDGMEKKEKKHGYFAFQCLTALFLFLFLTFVSYRWEENRQKLCRLLLPGDSVATAVDRFANALHKGNSIQDAVAAFYWEMANES